MVEHECLSSGFGTYISFLLIQDSRKSKVSAGDGRANQNAELMLSAEILMCKECARIAG